MHTLEIRVELIYTLNESLLIRASYDDENLIGIRIDEENNEWIFALPKSGVVENVLCNRIPIREAFENTKNGYYYCGHIVENGSIKIIYIGEIFKEWLPEHDLFLYRKKFEGEISDWERFLARTVRKGLPS